MNTIQLPENVEYQKIYFDKYSESVWAVPLENNIYIMGNIPFDENLPNLGDHFSFNEYTGEFKIIKKVSETYMYRYSIGENKEETQKRYTEIKEHMEKINAKTEGCYPGMLSVAVPIDSELNEDKINEHFLNGPYAI